MNLLVVGLGAIGTSVVPKTTAMERAVTEMETAVVILAFLIGFSTCFLRAVTEMEAAVVMAVADVVAVVDAGNMASFEATREKRKSKLHYGGRFSLIRRLIK